MEARQSPRCSGCLKFEGDEHLKKCSRCNLAKYCSKECQINDFDIHKLYCKPSTIPTLKKNLEAMVRLSITDVRSDFENGLEITFKAWNIFMMAVFSENHELYETFLECTYEALNVNPIQADTLLTLPAVAVLLNLGRDQEAYNLLKFTILLSFGGTMYENGTMKLVNGDIVIPGQFKPKTQDMKENVFEYVTKDRLNEWYDELYFRGSTFFIPLTIIKLNLVQKMRANLNQVTGQEHENFSKELVKQETQFKKMLKIMDRSKPDDYPSLQKISLGLSKDELKHFLRKTTGIPEDSNFEHYGIYSGFFALKNYFELNPSSKRIIEKFCIDENNEMARWKQNFSFRVNDMKIDVLGAAESLAYFKNLSGNDKTYVDNWIKAMEDNESKNDPRDDPKDDPDDHSDLEYDNPYDNPELRPMMEEVKKYLRLMGGDFPAGDPRKRSDPK